MQRVINEAGGKEITGGDGVVQILLLPLHKLPLPPSPLLLPWAFHSPPLGKHSFLHSTPPRDTYLASTGGWYGVWGVQSLLFAI